MSFLSGTPAETFSAIVTDLTERKLAQDALHQAISELEHFSFTVVHEDQGMGIPKGAQKDLFVMFKRANTDREGAGVGLALVRKVVERMGGRVGVESEEGHGSRFWVEFVAAPQNWSMLRSGHVPNSGGKSS